LNRLNDGAFQRDIRDDQQSHFEIMDNVDYVTYNITEGLKAMDEVRFAIDDPDARIDFRYIPFWAKSLEKYRWPVTMAFQCESLAHNQGLMSGSQFSAVFNKKLVFLKSNVMIIFTDLNVFYKQRSPFRPILFGETISKIKHLPQNRLFDSGADFEVGFS
jgi:hypothetical protein